MINDTAILRHIMDAAHRVGQYTQDGETVFLATPQLQDATVRNLEVIGEACKRVSPEMRAQQPGIDWAGFAKMRDRLIHKYFRVDLNIVWDTALNDIPDLESKVRLILHERETETS